MAGFADARLTPDDQLRILRDFTSALVGALTVDDVLRSIARCAQHALAWDDCVIYLVGEHGRLVQRAAFGAKSPDGEEIVDPIELDFGQGIVGSAAATGEPQLVVDTRLDDRYIVDDRSRRSELAVPIVVGNEVIGVIDSEHDEVGYYTSTDQKLLQDVASIAAVRVKAALTLEQVEASRLRMKELASTDELTGLGNRRRFEARIDEALAADESFSICILDLDRFKLVNDRLGHAQGDAVIIQMGEILRRQIDSETTTTRLGGDEFGLVRVGPGHEELAHDIAAIVEAVRHTSWNTDGAVLDLAVSAGLAAGRDENVWLHADDALLVAKAAGGDRLTDYDASAPKAAALKEDRNWVGRITRAVAEDRFFLLAQAIAPTDPESSQPTYYELLLRYTATDGTVVTPARFLDSAARYGLLERIDTWVIHQATEFLARAPHITASINVTPGSMTSGLAVTSLAESLAEHSVDPSRVILEVTEHAAIDDEERFASQVRAARALGVRIAIDDLGSGWTSLAVLRDNPVDIVKIDGAWVTRAASDPVSRVAVASLAECARLLGALVVAEWVEDEATRRLMGELGVDYVQGYLIGKPGPLDDLVGDRYRDAA